VNTDRFAGPRPQISTAAMSKRHGSPKRTPILTFAEAGRDQSQSMKRDPLAITARKNTSLQPVQGEFAKSRSDWRLEQAPAVFLPTGMKQNLRVL
jgi:hypothetical protein